MHFPAFGAFAEDKKNACSLADEVSYLDNNTRCVRSVL
jgi:hypothetical protein